MMAAPLPPPPFLIKITIPCVSQISPRGRIARAKKSKPDTANKQKQSLRRNAHFRGTHSQKKIQKALAQNRQPLDSFAFQLNERAERNELYADSTTVWNFNGDAVV